MSLRPCELGPPLRLPSLRVATSLGTSLLSQGPGMGQKGSTVSSFVSPSILPVSGGKTPRSTTGNVIPPTQAGRGDRGGRGDWGRQGVRT